MFIAVFDCTHAHLLSEIRRRSRGIQAHTGYSVLEPGIRLLQTFNLWLSTSAAGYEAAHGGPLYEDYVLVSKRHLIDRRIVKCRNAIIPSVAAHSGFYIAQARVIWYGSSLSVYKITKCADLMESRSSHVFSPCCGASVHTNVSPNRR
jgi:hypothetical protein